VEPLFQAILRSLHCLRANRRLGPAHFKIKNSGRTRGIAGSTKEDLPARLFIPGALRISHGHRRLAMGHRRRAPHRFAGETTIEEKE
jgi:hypothetical protein